MKIIYFILSFIKYFTHKLYCELW